MKRSPLDCPPRPAPVKEEQSAEQPSALSARLLHACSCECPHPTLAAAAGSCQLCAVCLDCVGRMLTRCQCHQTGAKASLQRLCSWRRLTAHSTPCGGQAAATKPHTQYALISSYTEIVSRSHTPSMLHCTGAARGLIDLLACTHTPHTKLRRPQRAARCTAATFLPPQWSVFSSGRPLAARCITRSKKEKPRRTAARLLSHAAPLLMPSPSLARQHSPYYQAQDLHHRPIPRTLAPTLTRCPHRRCRCSAAGCHRCPG